MNKSQKLWGAAFLQSPSEAVIAFTAGRDAHSIPAADLKLLPYDILGSQAHCLMLIKQGIIPKKDGNLILKGLSEIEQLVREGEFVLDPVKEDVHTNIESWLTQKYGIDVAGKLHTARSRNDQVNLDTRLYLKDTALSFVAELFELEKTLVAFSQKYSEFLFPGFTHHQHAMVTTFGHVLLSFAVMLERDIQKFVHWCDLHNKNPLGNVVSYGTTFPIDREYTSKLLGLEGPELSSMDEITNRWEAEADVGYAIVSLMNHLSLVAETFILLSTPEFGMLQLADGFSTGSSIMPQKKNPDPLEVIKGKAGFAEGQLVSLLSMGESNFIGYNRDSQWTKYVIMDLIDETFLAPKVVQGVIETMQVNKEVMEAWCHKGFIGATTLMEQIIQHYKLPMRVAKILVEKAVKYSVLPHPDLLLTKERGKMAEKISYAAMLKALKEEGIDIKITRKQIKSWQDPKTIIELTQSFGGPGPEAQKISVEILKKQLEKHKNWLKKEQFQREKTTAFLKKEISKVIGE